MQALVSAPDRPGYIAFREVWPRTPEPEDVVIAPVASSLNHGELQDARYGEAGRRLGWDVVGRLLEPGPSGLPTGSLVLGLSSKALGRGAWAERICVPADAVAPIPEGLRGAIDTLATLPVAGLTARHALGDHAELAGRRVLITGANGGVGAFAIQLAVAAGAVVVAQVRSPERAAWVEPFGAHRVLIAQNGAALRTALASEPPFDRVLDGVGGPMFASAISGLGPGGRAVTYGAAHTARFELSVWDLIARSGATIEGLHLDRALLAEPASTGLAALIEAVAAGSVRSVVERVRPWSEAPELAAALLARRFSGKAVIHFESEA